MYAYLKKYNINTEIKQVISREQCSMLTMPGNNSGAFRITC